MDDAELQRWNAQFRKSANQSTKDRWLNTISHFTSCAPDLLHQAESWFDRLTNEYSNPDRHYHNLAHIRNILNLILIFRDSFECREELLAYELAAWFHDAVYDTHRDDNEQCSAELLATAAVDLTIPDEITRLAQQWILVTKDHNPPDLAAGAFCDADLAILGSPMSVYRTYRADIRKEYAWVPEPEYRSGRARVLQHFLSRARVYSTPRMYEQRESAARLNMKSELSELL